ncbi:hypothetical protein GGR50DRAFT_248382 [Xylaria sp. CBS 124048]|nr:hypothetical protein GGR50DRAFT_248382 [Xylaria sp. CBS 124048]
MCSQSPPPYLHIVAVCLLFEMGLPNPLLDRPSEEAHLTFSHTHMSPSPRGDGCASLSSLCLYTFREYQEAIRGDLSMVRELDICRQKVLP